MANKKLWYWRLCYSAAILLVIITFTPLVTPMGVSEPFVLGMPRTLWTGYLVTFGLVALTYLATLVYPPNSGEDLT